MKNESEIIQSVILGHDRYEELVVRYHVGLVIHCDRLVGNRSDAEDIAQEAFVKAYLQLDRYQPDKAKFSTWLYKIATNLSLDYLRKQKRVTAVTDIESVTEVTMPTFIEDEERNHIRKTVLALMPPEYRRVIEAYYWLGKSYEEIAQDEQIPLNTARTWLRRAKLKLKEELI